MKQWRRSDFFEKYHPLCCSATAVAVTQDKKEATMKNKHLLFLKRMAVALLILTAGIISHPCMAHSNELPYNEDNWKQFIKPYANGSTIKLETLCKSNKGRDVKILRIRKARGGKRRILLTARHDAKDAVGNYVIEGLIDAILSNAKDREWFQQHTEIVIIPFVDKDGVKGNVRGIDYSNRYGEEGIREQRFSQNQLGRILTLRHYRFACGQGMGGHRQEERTEFQAHRRMS
jgi:hypothetical protein